MGKNQNADNRNQDRTDNKSNQKQNEDYSKRVIDPNNPIANKDKQPGNQNPNDRKKNAPVGQDKPQTGKNPRREEDDTLVKEKDSKSREIQNPSRNSNPKK